MADTIPTTRVLVAEDEAPLRNLVELSLLNSQYEVITANDGQEAIDKFRHDGPFDLVILDIMMPRKDGFEVLQEIRRESDVPIVILTALGTSEDIVQGFQLGADDYITKPFTFREVSARIEAILRRVRWMKEENNNRAVLRMGDIVIDDQNHTVLVRGEEVDMTPIEFKLLRYFMTHPDIVLSKQQLFKDVWGYEYAGSTNLVEVGVRRLREKIEADPSHPRLIVTIRGRGYRFRTPANNGAS